MDDDHAMLGPDELAELLAQFRGEQVSAETELAAVQRHVNFLRQAATGIQGLLSQDGPGEPAAVPTVTGRPRGAEAIRRVLEENDGKGWTVREMNDELGRRGWLPSSESPIDATRTAMLRAWRAPDSGIFREGGRFFHGLPSGRDVGSQE